MTIVISMVLHALLISWMALQKSNLVERHQLTEKDMDQLAKRVEKNLHYLQIQL